MSFGTHQNLWIISGTLGYKKNEVDYVAYPSSPNQLNSQTNEKIIEANLDLGYLHKISSVLSLQYTAGIGIRNWSRDIQSLPDIPGLEETYNWPYVSLGLKPSYLVNPQNSIGLLLQIRKAFNATLDVEFKDNLYDPVTLDLPDGLGLHLQGVWLHKLDQNSRIGLAPYIDLWKFDRSDQYDLKINGVSVGYISEPKNLTRSLGLELIFTKTF